MTRTAAPLPPETVTAAGAWALQHGCTTIEACHQAPLAAFAAGMAAQREHDAQLAESTGASYLTYSTDLDPVSTRRPFAALLRQEAS